MIDGTGVRRRAAARNLLVIVNGALAALIIFECLAVLTGSDLHGALVALVLPVVALVALLSRRRWGWWVALGIDGTICALALFIASSPHVDVLTPVLRLVFIAGGAVVAVLFALAW